VSRRRPERARPRGVALVAAVAGTALVLALAVGAGRWALAGTRLAAGTAAALQSEALVRSGIALAAVVLEERALAGEPDTLASPLAPELLEQSLGGGRVRIAIEDAARRLDLGAPELAPAVSRLLEAAGLAPGLGDALADWIDADDAPRPRGAERDWYLGRRPVLLPPNAPLGSVSELALVRGFDGGTVARLRPWLVAMGERAVNPNTAPPEVLRAWLRDDAAAERIAARRLREIVPCRGLPACTTQSRVYLVHLQARVHGVRRAVEATLWVPPAGAAEVRAVRSATGDIAVRR
jgi:general secretion pathway protein K